MPPTATTPPTITAASASTTSATTSYELQPPQTQPPAGSPPPPLPPKPAAAAAGVATTDGDSTAVPAISGKAVTAPDRYDATATLCAELRDQAERELRETEAVRQQALTAMREWIEQNPRLERVRFDASFLLRFLRARKFSLPLAQDSLERCLLLRQSYEALLFSNINIAAEPMRQLLAAGYCFALPGRDRSGRRIVFYRPAVFNPARHPNTELLRLHGVTYETLMEDEANQVRGLVHVVDARGVGLHYLTLFTPREAVRIVKNAERTLPMRHKQIVAVGVPSRMRFAVDFGLSLVTAKLRDRIRLCEGGRAGNEELRRLLGADVLPDEYGGKGGTVAQMAEMWRVELERMQPVARRNDEMRVRLELYAARAKEGAVGALRRPLGRDEEAAAAGGERSQTDGGGAGEMQGSFRKLEVD